MRIKSLLLLFSILLFTAASAQQSGVSPYSRFGIGDPTSGGFTTNFGMAGLGIGFVDRVHINPINAAMLPYLATPGFEVGLLGASERFNTTSQELTNGYVRLDHFSLGLPMGSGKWGGSIGLTPYTVRSFKGATTEFIPELDVENTIEYEGDGGLNKANLSLARRIRVYKDTSRFNNSSFLSLAATMNYYFGSQELIRNSLFPNNSGFHNIRATNTTTVNDIAPSFAMAYRHVLNKKTSKDDLNYSIGTVGLVYEPSILLSSTRSERIATFIGTSGEFEVGRDSIFNRSGIEGKLTLPTHIGVGGSMEFYFKDSTSKNRRKIVLGVDYTITSWTELESEFEGQRQNFNELMDESNLMIGLQYSPDLSVSSGQRGNLLRMGSYRIGGRITDTHLNIDNQALTEYGMSFGASFPVLMGGLKNTDTEISIGLEYGKRGTTDNDLIEETFSRVMVGFVFHPDKRFDRWFQKRKYD